MNQNEALVKSAIHDAVIRAVTEISADVKGLLKDALARETNETAQSMLRSMVDNLSIAKEGDKAVCQSPGYPTTWLSFGVHQGGHLGGRGRGHEEGLPAPLHGGPPDPGELGKQHRQGRAQYRV